MLTTANEHPRTNGPCGRPREAANRSDTGPRRWAWLCGAVLMALVTGRQLPISAAEPQDLAGIEFFESHIRPALVKHCYSCHSSKAKSRKGGLLLDTRSGIRQGGDSGTVVVPGKAEESLLIEAIREGGLVDMPPDGPLPEATVDKFEKWVAMGAPDPRDGAILEKSGDSNLWAFQAPRRPTVPAVRRADWPQTDIDHFLLARLEAAELEPVAEADRRSLIRRLYFDLTGLPPTPEQTESFVRDPSSTPAALESVVDELLGSPHFGERWGRHWLDLARYAESTGKEWNWAHPQAWRYRDYVIGSFNDDKPYDQFLREQIAGDLLPADDSAERDEQRIATGFLAIGPKSVSINNDEQFWLDLADEQINTVSRAVLGITASCARCHDHKFDPIPTKDYYALAGVFMSTETLFGTAAVGFKGRNNKQGTPLIPVGPEAEQKHEAIQEHDRRVQALSDVLKKQRDVLKKLRNQQTENRENEKSAEKDAEEAQRRDERIAEVKAEIEKQEQELKQLEENSLPRPEYAMGVRDRAEPQDTPVRIGGEFNQRGDPVPRGFLSAVELPDCPEVRPKQSGRLQLAQWLTHAQNPLTARVMVNRVWQHLFGRGLVPTVDNFGWLGQPPSHPQLLDHLAISFIEDDWSVKRLIRRIVLSRTYQLSTAYGAAQAAADPDNVLHWRMTPRRLEAEEIRDAILAISGRLKRQPLDGSPAVAQLGSGWIGIEVKEPEFKSYSHQYRSIYLPIVRDQVPEILQTFDFPNPAEVTGQRDVTMVPAQTLYLMNNEFVVASARQAAERLLASDELSQAQRIARAYRAVLARPPSPSEARRDQRLVHEMQQMLEQAGRESNVARRDAWAALFQTLFSSGEFLFLF